MAETPLPIIAEGAVDAISMDEGRSTILALDTIKRFSQALETNNATALEGCFYADQAYWKDLLALTYHLRTFRQAGPIAASLIETKNLRGVYHIELDGEARFATVGPTLVSLSSFDGLD
ncbi:uncharacterized protein ColSpa_12435 [Colletotrichum spaethianum]|uniref:Uncharacterized protein n=1 Tax=Colletotrichum spaethianum TaxID=700344 RepID=A0AA37PHH9_9PEZI|nr:uncharacterized protein ColSpa_12435 [Colletotrichum spaethianum]GKT52254.1 hypothetical protein ColSpa_12435 [Colletotrichum spaethianum]